MQEVFEKIKERLETELNLANEDREGYLHGNSKQYEFGKAVGHGNGIAVALEIINQVAEEYVPDINVGNNDVFCEWHKVKNGVAYKSNTHAEIYDSRVLDWRVCPYCEKKTKVVE